MLSFLSSLLFLSPVISLFSLPTSIIRYILKCDPNTYSINVKYQSANNTAHKHQKKSKRCCVESAAAHMMIKLSRRTISIYNIWIFFSRLYANEETTIIIIKQKQPQQREKKWTWANHRFMPYNTNETE